MSKQSRADTLCLALFFIFIVIFVVIFVVIFIVIFVVIFVVIFIFINRCAAVQQNLNPKP